MSSTLVRSHRLRFDLPETRDGVHPRAFPSDATYLAFRRALEGEVRQVDAFGVISADQDANLPESVFDPELKTLVANLMWVGEAGTALANGEVPTLAEFLRRTPEVHLHVSNDWDEETNDTILMIVWRDGALRLLRHTTHP